MDVLVVGFLVKLLDMPAAAIGLLGGWYSRNWLHLVMTAFVGGSAGEVILYMREDARAFDPTIWLVGVVACFAWAVVAYLIRSLLSRTK